MPSDRHKISFLYALASFVSIIVCLYWGKAVLLQVALAILLAFLLSPVVNKLQSWDLRRSPALLLIVILSFSLLGGITWAVVHEVASLTSDLSHDQDNMQHRLADLRGVGQPLPCWLSRYIKGAGLPTRPIQRPS